MSYGSLSDEKLEMSSLEAVEGMSVLDCISPPCSIGHLRARIYESVFSREKLHVRLLIFNNFKHLFVPRGNSDLL